MGLLTVRGTHKGISCGVKVKLINAAAKGFRRRETFLAGVVLRAIGVRGKRDYATFRLIAFVLRFFSYRNSGSCHIAVHAVHVLHAVLGLSFC